MQNKTKQKSRINELLKPVLFPAERGSAEEAHPSAHGRRADRQGQGRGAGFCAVGRVHQRICISGQSSQAFQREPHLCNVTHFSVLSSGGGSLPAFTALVTVKSIALLGYPVEGGVEEPLPDAL